MVLVLSSAALLRKHVQLMKANAGERFGPDEADEPPQKAFAGDADKIASTPPVFRLTAFQYRPRIGSERKPKIMSDKPAGAEKKIAAGICGILLGALGIHKFILGYTKEGVIMLLITVLTLGIAGGIMAIIGLIEGILYLTKSDEDFVNTYVTNKKGWF